MSQSNVKHQKLPNPKNFKSAKSIYEFNSLDIHGNVVPLEIYRGHVCIIVNVASECAYTTTNYTEFEELYEAYSDSQGLRILAYPCNQFGQEPGTNQDICHYIEDRNVKFDVFRKIHVNGNNAEPLWKYLKHKQGGGSAIKGNFTKFICDKHGQPVERHGPHTNPKDLVVSLVNYW